MKLKGRENFKLQMTESTKVNLGLISQKNGQGEKGSVPKLNLGQLERNHDFRDWYQYALKLEESIKYLR